MILTPKEQASEIVESFMGLTYCFFGSGMLTNSFDHDIDLENRKKCATIMVKKILDIRPGFPYHTETGEEVQGIYNMLNYPTNYWQEVLEEVSKIKHKSKD